MSFSTRRLRAKFKDWRHSISSIPPPTIMPSALAYLGLNPDSHDQADLEKAADLLMKVRPNIASSIRPNISTRSRTRTSASPSASRRRLPGARPGGRGEGRRDRSTTRSRSRARRCGSTMLAIPADAPHVAEAHEFINYMMKPEVIAKASNYVFYANGNKASQEFLDKEVLEDTAYYPSDAVMQKLFTTTPFEARSRGLLTPALDQDRHWSVGKNLPDLQIGQFLHVSAAQSRRCRAGHCVWAAPFEIDEEVSRKYRVLSRTWADPPPAFHFRQKRHQEVR